MAVTGPARYALWAAAMLFLRSPGGLKVYGSGLLSSYGEIAHAIDSPDVQRYPVQLEWVIKGWQWQADKQFVNRPDC